MNKNDLVGRLAEEHELTKSFARELCRLGFAEPAGQALEAWARLAAAARPPKFVERVSRHHRSES